MAGTISPIYDAEAEDIKRQMAFAQALRNKSLETDGRMVGRVYVQKNPWANFLEGLAGAGIGEWQNRRQQGLEQRMGQERQNWLNSLPSSTVELEGPTETGEAMTGLKGAKQRAQEMQQWAMGAPRGMEGVQQFALQQALTAPQREEEARQRAADRNAELAAKYAELRAAQQERLAQQFENQKALKEIGLQNAMALKAMGGGGGGSKPDMRIVDTVDENGNPVKQVIDLNAMKPGDRLGKPIPPGKGGKMTPEQAKQAELASLDDLIRRTQEVAKSPGLEAVTGPIAGRLPGVAYAGSPEASSALSNYDKYMEYLQTAGLEDLKAKGISPGSITEKEWPKFVARKTSLDRVKTTPEVKTELGRLTVDAYNTRARVAGTGETYHYVDGKIYALPPGADPKRKSSYTEVK